MSAIGHQAHLFGPFIQTDGTPYSGARIYTYDAGTTNNRATYESETSAVLAANPLVCNDAGYAVGFLEGDYHIVIKASVADGGATLPDGDIDGWKFEGKAATLRGENQGAAYPAATTGNLGQIFAKTAAGVIVAVGINKSGVAFADLSFQGDPLTSTQQLAKGADLGSASTLTLGTDGNFFDVTGAVTITAISAKAAGTIIGLQFDGAPLLTHNGTSLVLAGGVDYQAKAGDIIFFQSEGSGNWREAFSNRFHIGAKGDLLVGNASNLPVRKPVGTDNAYLMVDSSQTDGLNWNLPATQAEQETATSLAKLVTSGRQQFHPSACKAWAVVTGAGTPALAGTPFNVASVTDNGVGDFSITFTVPFSTVNYVPAAICWDAGVGAFDRITVHEGALSGSATRFKVAANAETAADPQGFFCHFFGDQ
jgi:hypothetical protein